jgi:hypothetical protein
MVDWGCNDSSGGGAFCRIARPVVGDSGGSFFGSRCSFFAPWPFLFNNARRNISGTFTAADSRQIHILPL